MFFVLLLLLAPQSGEGLIGIAADVLSFGFRTLVDLHDAQEVYDGLFAEEPSLNEIMDAVTELSSKIDEMEARIESKLDNLFEKLITQLPRLGQRARAMEELSTVIEEIDRLYRFFERTVTNTTRHVNNITMELFVDSITSIDPGHLMSLLDRIHGLIVPKRSSVLRESFLELIDEESKGSNHDRKSCGNGVDRPTLISEIYTTLMVTEIRGMMMIGFSYTMLELLNNVSYAAELNFATEELKDRCADYLDTFTNAAHPPSEIRNCDPPGGWIRGESYFEFERFRALYVFSEEGFNDPPSCKTPHDSEDVQISCDASQLCTPENECRGHLKYCTTDNYAWICPVEDSNSLRRYWDLSAKRGRWSGLGNEKNCEFDTNQFLKGHTDSDNNYCKIYYCDCFEDSYDSHSMRTLSYREQMSDINDNKIVTGVKLVNNQRMIHIQIQQGTVIPQGNVDPDSVDWKPLENILYDEAETLEKQALTYYVEYDNGTKELLQEEQDFAGFTYDEDLIGLDDIEVPRDYVITGIRFSFDRNSEKKARWFEIHATAYDYLIGKLILDNPDYPPKWLTPDDMKGVLPAYDNKRSVYGSDSADLKDPTRANQETEPVAGPNILIGIERTEDVFDAGQTTLPLLDNRAVIATPPFALGTIGFFFKTPHGYQHGFLAFRLSGIDTIATLQL